MNSIFRTFSESARPAARLVAARPVNSLLLCHFLCQSLCSMGARADRRRRDRGNSNEFPRNFPAARLDGGDVKMKRRWRKALAFLDSIAVSDLNTFRRDRTWTERIGGLAELASHTPPVGRELPARETWRHSHGLCHGNQFRPRRPGSRAEILCRRRQALRFGCEDPDHFVQKDFSIATWNWRPSRIPNRYLSRFPAGRTICPRVHVFCMEVRWTWGGRAVEIRICSSNRAMRPMKWVFVSHTVPRWMTTIRRSVSRCRATSTGFRPENGSESRRPTCRCQHRQRNKRCLEWAAPRVIKSFPPPTSIRLKSTSKC